MQNDLIEDRFKAATLHLCSRWECFDSRRHPAGTLVDGPWRYEFSADHPIQAMREGIQTSGAREAVRSLLRSHLLGDFNVELSAHNRLDLALEAFCLRPAWKLVFDAEDRRTAVKRLTELMAFASSGALVPPPGADLDSTIAWVNEQTLWVQHDPSLPRSTLSYAHSTLGKEADVTEPNWCNSVAESVREVEEVGCFRTSLQQCLHYCSCVTCTARWPQIDRLARRFEETTFDTCRQVLKVLITCVDRLPNRRVALLQQDRYPEAAEAEALAWRALICAAGAEYVSAIDELRGLLDRQLPLDERDDSAIQQFLSRLTGEEVLALRFSEVVNWLFIEVQWGLFERDDLLYLPTDGDLSDIPVILSVLPCSDFAQWQQLMTGSDLAFRQVRPDGSHHSISVDAEVLIRILEFAAAFWHHRSPAAAEFNPLSFYRTGAPERRGLIAAQPAVGTVAPAQIRPDRNRSLADSVKSDAAVRTIKGERSEPFGASRYRAAEESLVNVLGERVYLSLCPRARNAALVAEYCWLDTQFPDPSKVVSEFATAFERQLRERALRPFCESLNASRVRNYPEPDGPASNLRPPAVGGPNPGINLGRRTLPVLLSGGQMNERLTLGDMAWLLERRLPAMRNFLVAFGLDAERLAVIARRVAAKRNPAQHEGGVSREEAEDVRRDWLGLADPDSNIFGALIATKRNVGSAATRGPVDS